MSDNLLGVAVCDECDARIRIFRKHEALVGKNVRCPRCHTRFALTLEEASEKDRIAIEADQAERSAKRKKRRTKHEIRYEHVATAREGFRALHERLSAIANEKRSSEEQVRVWCIDVLRTALGYEDAQLDTESKVMGGRVDIAIKEQDEVQLIIECKNIRSRLRNNVREQAGVYAATLSAPWAVVTNGDIWKLYRVTPQKGMSPRMDLVFDVALLDEDGISDEDAEKLYLLSHRALSSGDTESEYHGVRCSGPSRVYEALFSERVLSAMRIELASSYKEETEQSVKLSDEDAEDALKNLLTPLEFGV
ncbi:hypothetical protein MalM25_26310 [Planctomycetes bacterium MalM25]|nr:hypothetical protein MalM25_26310 [Planctomycetes bacterium MalM25]